VVSFATLENVSVPPRSMSLAVVPSVTMTLEFDNEEFGTEAVATVVVPAESLYVVVIPVPAVIEPPDMSSIYSRRVVVESVYKLLTTDFPAPVGVAIPSRLDGPLRWETAHVRDHSRQAKP